MRRRRLLVIAALALLIGAGALWWKLRPHSTVTYMTAAADIGTVAPFVTASGSVNPVVTVQVGTYVSGVIQTLNCDFNTQVHKDQLCAKIDPRPYQTIVDQDKAGLANARAQLQKDLANLDYTRISYQRVQALLAIDSASKDTVDIAHNAWDQAQAQIGVDQAMIAQRAAELRTAQVNLDYTNIVSPVDGTVVSRNVTQGQTVAASFQTPTLFVIATDLTQMQVDTSVSESDIGDVRPGNDAAFTVEAFPKHSFTGHVAQVRQAPQTVQNVVTYDVVVNADNPQLLLKPGMTAAVRIITQHHDAVLRVPAQALRYMPTEAAVAPRAIADAGARAVPRGATTATLWLLRDGAPQSAVVIVGLNDDSYAEILQGDVHAGDRVIIAEHANRTASGSSVPGQITPRAPRM